MVNKDLNTSKCCQITATARMHVSDASTYTVAKTIVTTSTVSTH